jgi:hypothetical protein|nr:hypothetical protein [Kofleriaceae bacterium]
MTGRLAAAIVTMLCAQAAADTQHVGALDAPKVTEAQTLACAASGGSAGDGVVCSTMVSRTVGGVAVRVVSNMAATDEVAYVELGGATGSLFYTHVRHYSPGMGERSEPVQTTRDWAATPRLVDGTLADGSAGVVVEMAWTTRDFDKDTGAWLGAAVSRDVLQVCSTTACAPAIDVECGNGGCHPKLTRGTLAW